MTDPKKLLAKLRTVALALPEVVEEPWHDHAVFKVRKKTFLNFMNHHHGDGRVAIWCKAAPGTQAQLVDLDPEVFFVPPYMGPSGWVGMRLDLPKTDWGQVKDVVAEGWRLQAPKTLVAGGASGPAAPRPSARGSRSRRRAP